MLTFLSLPFKVFARVLEKRFLQSGGDNALSMWLCETGPTLCPLEDLVDRISRHSQ